MPNQEDKTQFLTYRDKPLVRNGNTIYYGDMSDEFVIMMHIIDTEPLDDIQLANKVIVQLIHTDPEMRPRERIVKKSEKIGLYNAMDIGSIWLTRALEGK